jgi:hypothetical protein
MFNAIDLYKTNKFYFFCDIFLFFLHLSKPFLFFLRISFKSLLVYLVLYFCNILINKGISIDMMLIKIQKTAKKLSILIKKHYI